MAHKEESSRMVVVLVGSELVVEEMGEQVVVEDQVVVQDPMHLKPRQHR